MLIFGILQLGWAVWQYNLVADLAQEGARWASVRGSTSASQGGDAAATNGSVGTYVSSRALGMTVTTSATWPSGNTPGSVVQVTVTRSLVRFSTLIPMPSSVSSTARMVIAR
jgi:Flp pilus assembly protein TadG